MLALFTLGPGPWALGPPRRRRTPPTPPASPPAPISAPAPAPAPKPELIFQPVLLAVFPDEQYLRITGLTDLGGGRVRLLLAGGGTLEIGVDNLKEITYEEIALRPESEPVPATPAEALPPFTVPPALDPLIRAAALKHGLDWKLVVSLIKAESNFNPAALSRAGAQGLMQLMPATARQYGVVHPFVPAENLDGGCAYLRYLVDRYPGDLDRVLAAYNAGEGAVQKHNGVPPFRETIDYVKRINGYLNSFKPALAPAPPPVISPAPGK